MSQHYRVVCPDMPGRGRSEWLKDPAEYAFPIYLADCAALIARLDVESVDWVGTSMGALIGMMLASQPTARCASSWSTTPAPSFREGLTASARYIGADPTFESIEAMEAAVRTDHAPFGPLTDAQWRKLAIDSARRSPAAATASTTIRGSATLQGRTSRRRRPLAVWDAVALPDADPARRAIGHPVARGRRGDDEARAESRSSSSSPASATRRRC